MKNMCSDNAKKAINTKRAALIRHYKQLNTDGHFDMSETEIEKTVNEMSVKDVLILYGILK